MELARDEPAYLVDDLGSHDTARSDEDVAALQAAILEKLTYVVGKRRSIATDRDWLMACASHCATRLSTAGWRHRRRVSKRFQAGLLHVAGVPDRSPAV